MWIWQSKLRGRPWVRGIAGGVQQIYTRILGTTVVVPATPRTLTYLARVDTQLTLLARRDTSFTYFASES